MKIKTFEAFSMNKDICDRCGGDTNGHTIMSMYNEDIICMRCKDKEKQRGDYSVATDADNEEIKKGNYNFKGIGYLKESSDDDIQKWDIFAGLGGGFGGATYVRTETCSRKDAENCAYEDACEEYESLAGMHGIRSHDDIMEEDDVDSEEADQIYNEERESWIDYCVKPHDPKNQY